MRTQSQYGTLSRPTCPTNVSLDNLSEYGTHMHAHTPPLIVTFAQFLHQNTPLGQHVIPVDESTFQQPLLTTLIGGVRGTPVKNAAVVHDHEIS